MSDPKAAFDRAFSHVLGHQAVSVGSIGIRAGLFAGIDDRGPVSASELAAGLGFDEHLVRVWCRAAFAFEFLDTDSQGRYRLTPGTATVLLDEAHPLYMGGRLLFATATWQDTLVYPDAFADQAVRSFSERDPLVLEAMRATSAPDSTMLIEHVLPQTPELVEALDEGGAILEIGCGSAQLALALARRFPNARLVGVEFDPASVAQARTAVHDAGLQHRIQLRHADANHLADRDTYELVVMNRSLHEVGGPDEHLNVLRRSRDALRAEGWTIVSELPYPDNEEDYRTNPDQRRLAGAQLHEAIVGCAMITTSQLTALMRNTGYHHVRVLDQPRSSRIVAIGQRPPQPSHLGSPAHQASASIAAQPHPQPGDPRHIAACGRSSHRSGCEEDDGCMSRFVEDIRRARRDGSLPERFRAEDVRRACPGWAHHTYGVFLPKHRKGNPGGYTAYFVQHPDGSFSLIN